MLRPRPFTPRLHLLSLHPRRSRHLHLHRHPINLLLSFSAEHPLLDPVLAPIRRLVLDPSSFSLCNYFDLFHDFAGRTKPSFD